MKLKKVEDMNLYEVLNLMPSCSQQDIDEAYKIGTFSYKQNSIAHYGLVSEDERLLHLQRIEEAFKTLGNPKKRKRYDVNILRYKSQAYDKAYYRNGTEKMIIEDLDTDSPPTFWQKLKSLFSKKS
ncbi:MAG: DnaJ domain-containing protein [Candidatus Aminicenantes bacterium]|nr:DnaJ domain-containing protein [Candidatus Aminicenantes bacterium]